MKINLIQKTENPLDVMWVAARTCNSRNTCEDLWNYSQSFSSEEKEKLIIKILKAGHMSIAEHVYLTFTVDEMTRSASHQFVRHRLATFSQKSQRYVTFNEPFGYTTPASIQVNSDAYSKFVNVMETIQTTYKQLIEMGIPSEDARDILPNACHTNLTVSFNLHEFIHICQKRMCTNAQFEIRDMIIRMAGLLLEDINYKFLGFLMAPACDTCTEYKKSCK